jgi:EAL domain-containing protein (putative c-di-GMP-specific phosphodiesterase class I)
MVAGRIPNAIPNAAEDPLAAALQVTADAGIVSYLGVPVRLADGTLYGSLCAVSHAETAVDAKDARWLAMIADLVAEQADADRAQRTAHDRIAGLIAAERIETAVQPIVEILTGRVLGVEALARFPGEFGPPDVVFAAAHAAGVGRELEQLAVRRALKILPLLGRDQYLSVNLDPAVALDLVGRNAHRDDIDFSRIVLEITEHSAVANYAELRSELAAARARGLRIAIDDAGAGYASLQHIVELTPDIIKIDRALVDGLARDTGRRTVAGAFLSLARGVNATVVAEGVEDHADLEAAALMGIEAAQGYLFARPSLDRPDLARWRSRPLVIGPRQRKGTAL